MTIAMLNRLQLVACSGARLSPKSVLLNLEKRVHTFL